MSGRLLRRYGQLEVVPDLDGKGLTIATAEWGTEHFRNAGMHIPHDHLPTIVDLVAMAEIEGRHAVDVLESLK